MLYRLGGLGGLKLSKKCCFDDYSYPMNPVLILWFASLGKKIASSAKFHSLRTYYHVIVWTGNERNMDARNWGWKLDDNQLVPSVPGTDAAPDNNPKMVHSNCINARYSCRGYRLDHVTVYVDYVNWTCATVHAASKWETTIVTIST